MPNLCLKNYLCKIHDARLNALTDEHANHAPQMIDGHRGLEITFSTPSFSRFHDTTPNTLPEPSLSYHSRDGLIKAIAPLSAFGTRRSRRRLTLVRDKANPNLPIKLQGMTYDDLFYWVPSNGR